MSFWTWLFGKQPMTLNDHVNLALLNGQQVRSIEEDANGAIRYQFYTKDGSVPTAPPQFAEPHRKHHDHRHDDRRDQQDPQRGNGKTKFQPHENRYAGALPPHKQGG
jgi:hypothetical protein